MALAPQNDRCLAFADYVLENYISSGAKFPPILWSEEPSDRRRTTNGCESFHCHFNEQLYTPYPSIFSFLDVITKHQCIMYIKLRNADCKSIDTNRERKTRFSCTKNGLVQKWRNFSVGISQEIGISISCPHRRMKC
jgi:hypothetical protein